MHVHSEHEGKRYKCEDCGKEYRSKDNLGRHRKIHAGVRFDCPHCPASFGQKAPLTRHIKRKHAAGEVNVKIEFKKDSAKNGGPRTVEEHLRAQQQQTLQLQQQQQQQQQLQVRLKNKPVEVIELQTDAGSLQQQQHQQQQSRSTTSALIVESADQLRAIGNIGAIVQTANGQTLTLLPQQLAQLTDGNFGTTTFSFAPIEVDADDRTGSGGGGATMAAVPAARFAIATPGDNDNDSGTATIMHAIQMTGETQTALPVGATVATALTDVGSQQQQHQAHQQPQHQQISLDTLASLTPIQTSDGDKETKFYLIPSGSWPAM